MKGKKKVFAKDHETLENNFYVNVFSNMSTPQEQPHFRFCGYDQYQKTQSGWEKTPVVSKEKVGILMPFFIDFSEYERIRTTAKRRFS